MNAWGGDESIIAAAEAFDILIYVHTPQGAVTKESMFDNIRLFPINESKVREQKNFCKVTANENTEDNSQKSNAMSLDDCSFAEEQQSENDEKIMEQGNSSDSVEEKYNDTKAMKNLAKTQNKRIVNNFAGGD
ncbi:MAG: hypothetical protein EZS28_005325 [Streblomastix strix]|uniref:Uncharacterized protein n=1 Tax=Streblomastix strix TaxID=222440 RepID=A0A5J4WW28_9EUKA|nr:MAG: hypothetical protein EZS28_005325 [Streblomastix strix]